MPPPSASRSLLGPSSIAWALPCASPCRRGRAAVFARRGRRPSAACRELYGIALAPCHMNGAKTMPLPSATSRSRAEARRKIRRSQSAFERGEHREGDRATAPRGLEARRRPRAEAACRSGTAREARPDFTKGDPHVVADDVRIKCWKDVVRDGSRQARSTSKFAARFVQPVSFQRSSGPSSRSRRRTAAPLRGLGEIVLNRSRNAWPPRRAREHLVVIEHLHLTRLRE